VQSQTETETNRSARGFPPSLDHHGLNPSGEGFSLSTTKGQSKEHVARIGPFSGWPAGWGTAQTRGRRDWAAGWNKEHACPPKAKEHRKRAFAGYEKGSFPELGKKRTELANVLRQAGYVARYRWPRTQKGVRLAGHDPTTGKPYQIPNWIYDEGPAQGLQAVDPWRVADRVSQCCAGWAAQLRIHSQTGPLILPVPRPCGLRHVCPYCANRRSVKIASALSAALDVEGRDGVYLVTLTQRDRIGESLRSSVDRLRTAFSLMTTGRPGKRWRALVSGWWVGMETTKAKGPQGALNRWHPHLHVLLRLRDTSPKKIRRAKKIIADFWRRASVSTSGKKFAWDPLSAVWDRRSEKAEKARARMKKGDFSGRWFIPVSTDREVYQAAKYPTPSVKLEPASVAEFLAVAFGRRWHFGGGDWHGIIGRGLAYLEASEESIAGVAVSGIGPEQSPNVDTIAAKYGTKKQREPVEGWVRWNVTDLSEQARETLEKIPKSILDEKEEKTAIYLHRFWAFEALNNAQKQIREHLRKQEERKQDRCPP